MVTDEEYEQAVEAGIVARRIEPRAKAASYDAVTNEIVVDLTWGFTVRFSPLRAQVLYQATAEQLSHIELEPFGFALYFPLLDEGIQIVSICKGRFGNDRWESDWAALHKLDCAA